MGRGKHSSRGGCRICSSQKKVLKENKKRRLRQNEELRREFKDY